MPGISFASAERVPDLRAKEALPARAHRPAGTAAMARAGTAALLLILASCLGSSQAALAAGRRLTQVPGAEGPPPQQPQHCQPV